VEWGLLTDGSLGERCDRAYLERSDEVGVRMLEGGQEGAGVAAEVRMAWKLGKPV
jgi:hypothetical protein